MNYKVFWSNLAKEDFSDILNYLQNNFSLDVALSFLENTEKIIHQISLFPFSFPKSETNKQLHKAVIHKHTSLIYRIKNEDIEILFFWDNRMEEIV